MADFADSKTALVADVDCTAGGKGLCEQHGIRGYPSIKYGDPNALEDYNGGRSYQALKEFAEKNLGPSCGPARMDLCDAEKKAQLEKLMAMSAADLDAQVKEQTDAMEKLEGDFKTFVEGLNKQYQEESKKKEDAIEAIKNSGLGMMKAVKAHNAKAKAEL
mmetsp:Transcript_66247/g.193884  ORF Transcript_66247/g.193884 Transcript_66247/m.193884 type:complete len:161 (+) Transcript_66247:253-735(+)